MATQRLLPREQPLVAALVVARLAHWTEPERTRHSTRRQVRRRWPEAQARLPIDEMMLTVPRPAQRVGVERSDAPSDRSSPQELHSPASSGEAERAPGGHQIGPGPDLSLMT